MKVWIATLVLLAFAGIGFLVFAMGHGTCIAELAAGRACPNTTPADYVLFHFTAFSLFSTAVFYVISGALALMLGLMLWTLAENLEERLRLRPVLVSARQRNLLHNFQNQRQIRAWLSILEKRAAA